MENLLISQNTQKRTRMHRGKHRNVSHRAYDHMTETQLQSSIIELATLLGWLSYHTHDSRHSAKGFPDLCLAHPRTGRLIFAELKSAKENLTEAQEKWRDALEPNGHEYYLWRPSHWESEEILQTIKPMTKDEELTGRLDKICECGDSQHRPESWCAGCEKCVDCCECEEFFPQSQVENQPMSCKHKFERKEKRGLCWLLECSWCGEQNIFHYASSINRYVVLGRSVGGEYAWKSLGAPDND